MMGIQPSVDNSLLMMDSTIIVDEYSATIIQLPFIDMRVGEGTLDLNHTNNLLSENSYPAVYIEGQLLVGPKRQSRMVVTSAWSLVSQN